MARPRWSAPSPAPACPACWPAYAGVLGSFGVSFLIDSRYLFALTAIFHAHPDGRRGCQVAATLYTNDTCSSEVSQSLCEAPASYEVGCLPVADADAGFDARACIAHQGQIACPQGFDESFEIYASSSVCTPCGCGVAENVGCVWRERLVTAVCTGTFSETSASGCRNILNPILSAHAVIDGDAPGSCQPSGGAALPAPTVSHTICCISAP